MSDSILQSAINALIECPQNASLQIQQLAASGNNAARMIYAHLLIDGVGIDIDKEEAAYWYSLAANEGHSTAMNQLGRRYELGLGLNKNDSLATVWYRKSAEAGDDWGMYNYANALATGRGVPQDEQAAFAWYLRAAQAGHAKSMNLVGRYYEQGLVIAADAKQAFAWYKRSAFAGDFRGQASYAGMLAEQNDMQNAVYWMRTSIQHANSAFKVYLANNLGSSIYPEFRELQAVIKFDSN